MPGMEQEEEAEAGGEAVSMSGYQDGNGNVCRIKAYAKINLGLDVLGKLPNGYHEVKMVMQTVGIYDEIVMEKIPAGQWQQEQLSQDKLTGEGSDGMESQIAVTTDSGELPVNEDNLIYKAAKLLFEKYNIAEGVRIHLQKNIPIAAGMAGGSTDAAATLKGLSRLFGLGCSMEELKELGVQIGADVPYCVMGGTALAEGIGEKLTELPPAPDCFLLVAKPDISVSTKYVYEHLDAKESYEHPDIDGMVRAMENGSLAGVAACMGNVLESVTVPAYPVIDTIKKRMRELGAAGSMMSGSGPTVFGIFTEKEKAENAYEEMKGEQLAKQVFLTGFCTGR